MKKRLWLYPVFCLAIGACLAWYFRPLPKISPVRSDIWISKRSLPAKIALDSYLAGNFARTNHDLDQAVDAYINVLKADPKNTSLLNDTYVLAMVQGVPEKILPFLDGVTETKMLADYARIVQLIRQNNLDKALLLLQQKKGGTFDGFLSPQIQSWIYAQKNDLKKAIQVLDSLPKNNSFAKGYQTFLLGIYFKQDDLIQKGIAKIGDNDLPAIGYFPLLKKVVSETGNWEKSALFKTYLELGKKYPATADLLVLLGEMDLTLEKALAETFYFASAASGISKMTREEALAANSLALLLQPDKQISLVWGAELSEGLELPKVALSYYNRLKFHSATLIFKKAAALMLLEKNEEALPLLEELEKTNKTSIPLLTLLGQAYQEQGQKERALEIYNRLIPLLEANLKDKPLIQAYMIRSILHGTDNSPQMLSDLEKAKILDPENAMLLNDLGYHQLETGLLDEGFDLVQKAYQKKPNDPYILDSLAFAYWKKGQSDMALPLAEKALSLMPQSALINAHLGDIYAALGRHREAGFQYKKALDLQTDLTDDLTQKLNQKLQEQK